MQKLRILGLAFVFIACLNITACDRGKTEVKSEPSTVTTTLGQELLDLDKAYKDGIITQKEYEKTKKRLIEKRTE